MTADRPCRTCGLHLTAHSGDVCPPCGRPVEHHRDGEAEECWAGRARMARARAAQLDAGHRGAVVGPDGVRRGVVAPLDDVDREALRRSDVAVAS